MASFAARLLGCLGAASAWMVDFTDRPQALEHFMEDEFVLDTSGSRACTEPSHLHYNQELSTCQGEELQLSGQRGLQLVLDYNVTCDAEDVYLATGHMQSRESFMYGSFSFVLRGHHTQGTCKEPETYAGFSCISLYTQTPLWNEIAVCFSKFSPHNEVHLSVFNARPQGESVEKVPVFGAFVFLDEPAYLDFHNYTLQRLPDSIVFWVDGAKKLEIDKLACPDLPTEPMRMKVILRPFRDKIEGSATVLSIKSLSAETLGNAVASKTEKTRLEEMENVTHQFVFIENFGGSFNEWVQLKRDVFHALDLDYPGRGLLSMYPIKLGRMLPKMAIAILQLGSENQAGKVAAFLNKNSKHHLRAKTVSEADYRRFGTDQLQSISDKALDLEEDDTHLALEKHSLPWFFALLVGVALAISGVASWKFALKLRSSWAELPSDEP